MKSIYFGEEHESFRRTVRQFLEAEVAPYAREWEEARRIPREVFRRMGDLGLLGILAPEELGGTGASIFHALAFLEELPRSLMGGFVAAVSVQQFIATGAIALHGTPEQKRRWLAPSIAGTKVGAIAISEPDAVHDPRPVEQSRRRGDTRAGSRFSHQGDVGAAGDRAADALAQLRWGGGLAVLLIRQAHQLSHLGGVDQDLAQTRLGLVNR